MKNMMPNVPAKLIGVISIGVATIGDGIVYVENRDGNVNVKTGE
jgi:phage repressor protein C with HTH and peptisase S24 domain